MSGKNFLTILVLLAGLLTVNVTQAETLEKVTLAQFGQSKFLLYLPLYIAQEEGFFAQQGLDVDLKFAGNDDQVFAAVMSGSVNYGMGDPVFTAIAAEKGGAAKTVAMLITRPQWQAHKLCKALWERSLLYWKPERPTLPPIWNLL